MQFSWPWRRRRDERVNPPEAWRPPPDGSTDGAPNPAWITRALDRIGADGPQVDRDLGGKEPMVDMWETGQLLPTDEQMDKLCAYTGQQKSYFYQATPRIVARACPGWRPIYEDEVMAADDAGALHREAADEAADGC